MHTVLCAVVVVLAGILHVLETYRYYRQGFEEGYDKGLASKKEPVTEPPVFGMQKRKIETLNFFCNYEPSEGEPPKKVIDAELNDGIMEQIKPFIRKHETVNDFGFGKSKEYHAQLRVVDERGEALDY